MPISGAPKSSVLTLTGALQVPPEGRTLDWITGAVVGPPAHATTTRPFGAIAATGAGAALEPVVSVTGADQVSPLALVLTSTDVRNVVSLYTGQVTTCAPAAFSANCWLPAAAGSGAGADQVLAAWAGSAAAAPVPSAINNAGSATRALRRVNRCMTNSCLQVLRGQGFFGCHTPGCFPGRVRASRLTSPRAPPPGAAQAFPTDAPSDPPR